MRTGEWIRAKHVMFSIISSITESNYLNNCIQYCFSLKGTAVQEADHNLVQKEICVLLEVFTAMRKIICWASALKMKTVCSSQNDIIYGRVCMTPKPRKSPDKT